MSQATRQGGQLSKKIFPTAMKASVHLLSGHPSYLSKLYRLGTIL